MMHRIAPNKILDCTNRNRIYEHICQHSGDYITQIQHAVNISMNAVIYHLGVLEKEGFVRSDVQRCRRMYYPIQGVSQSIYEHKHPPRNRKGRPRRRVTACLPEE